MKTKNIALLDAATGQVHILRRRRRFSLERHCAANGIRLADAEWMEFTRLLESPAKRAPRVVIDVLGGVATVRRRPAHVVVEIVDHDQP